MRLRVALAAAIAACVVSGCSKPDVGHDAPRASSTATHEEATGSRDRGGAPQAAAPAPDDALVEITATTFASTLRARRERVLLVNVWSTWCEPCIEEMPELLRVAREYAPRGLGLVLVSADARAQRDAAAAFLSSNAAPFPRYVKAGPEDAFVGAVHPAWTGALPVTVLFDSERRPQHLFEGRVDVPALERALDAMLPPAGSHPGDSP